MSLQPLAQTPVQVADKIFVRLAQFWKGYLRLDFNYRKDWIEKLKFVKAGKGKKDRYTLLSKMLLENLDVYFQNYKKRKISFIYRVHLL